MRLRRIISRRKNGEVNNGMDGFLNLVVVCSGGLSCRVLFVRGCDDCRSFEG